MVGNLLVHFPFLLKVSFVADEEDFDVGVGLSFEVLEPGVNVLKSFFTKKLKGKLLVDGIDHHGQRRVPVEVGDQGAVDLLPAGVPDLQLDHLVIYLHIEGEKLEAYCR